MSITSYAQNFEDVMLWRALGHVTQGFYVDIGAQHPIIDSVSKTFYENGWRGMHVEAMPTYAALLRADRPDEVVLQVALSDHAGTINFYEIPETGLSTADPSIAQQHRAAGYSVVETTTPCITLADVLSTVGQRDIHWLKIDVEGFERQVLSSWGLSSARPWIVVVESTFPMTQIDTHAAWEELLFRLGYQYAYFDGLNRFYVAETRSDLLQSFKTPPNIFDNFMLNGSANAPFHRRLEARHQAENKEKLAEFDHHQALLQREIDRLSLDLRGAQDQVSSAELKGSARETELLAKIDKSRLEIEGLLSQQVLREQDFSTHIAVAYKRAAEERSEVLRVLSESERDLHRQISELKEALRIEREAVRYQIEKFGRLKALEREQHHEALNQVKSEAAERQGALTMRLAALEAQLNMDRHTAEIREARLVSRQDAEKESLKFRHQERERALMAEIKRHERRMGRVQRLLKGRARSFSERLADFHRVQEHLEKDVFAKVKLIEGLQELQRSSEEQHTREIEESHEAYRELEANKASLEAALFAEIALSTRLRTKLACAAAGLAKIQSSLWWRILSLFRYRASVSQHSNANDLLVEGDSSTRSGPSEVHVVDTHGLKSAPPPKRENTFAPMTPEELFACRDAQFVQNAYTTLLRRPPDSAGFAHYLARVRGGIPLRQIAGEMLCSREGRKYDSAEFDSVRLEHRRLHHPLYGFLFRWAKRVDRHDRVEQKLAVLEDLISQLRAETMSSLTRIEISLGSISQDLSNNAASLVAAKTTPPPTSEFGEFGEIGGRGKQVLEGGFMGIREKGNTIPSSRRLHRVIQELTRSTTTI